MRNVVFVGCSLAVLTALAEAIILLQLRLDPWRLATALACLSLLVAAFVGMTQSGLIKRLRHWAIESQSAALGMPFFLLIPYLIFSIGTGTFSARALAKLAAYIAIPTVLLLPDRLRRAERVGWRDLAAMLALGLPISAGWLSGIWMWPQDLYFLRPLLAVCVGAYVFMVLRNLEGIGYRLTFRKGDVLDGLTNFAGFALLAIPLGMWLGFIHPHANRVSVVAFLTQFVGIYLTIAIPEELLFRGILQNFLVKSIRRGPQGLYGLLIASVAFGAAHLHHSPIPNWKYAILATLAGLFYGNAYRTRHRLPAPALTHTLVDTVWHFWF